MTSAGQPADRRETLRRAALGAGALAAAGLLRPVGANAQTTGSEDLRDFLVGAIALEQLTVLAYRTAGDRVEGDLRRTMELYRDQEDAHATALRAALDSLAFDPPPAPSSTTDSAAFEGIEGLDPELAKKLVGLLSELDGLDDSKRYLRYLLELEAEQLAYYTGAGSALESVDLTTTSAEIAGCQAQHSLVLGLALGATPADAAAEPSRAAADAVPTAA